MTLLYRTQTAGNRRTFTVSTWIKFTGSIGSAGAIILNTDGSGANQNFMYQLATDNTIKLHLYGGDAFTTSRKLMDYSNWYHIVLGVDTTQSTASDRIKLYINGELQSITQESLYPAQNFDFGVSESGRDMSIMGDYNAGGSNSYQNRSYLSHYHFCDGYQYQASDFGETDSTTGEWKIKTDPSVNYGSTGFFLKFEDSSNLTLDSGGNNISFSTSGTPIATHDNPSNVFCTLNGNIPQAGGVSGRDGSASTSLDNGNTTAGEGAAVFSNQLGTIFASSGKYYAECKFGGDQYCSFGVASPNFSDASLGSYPGASITGVNTAGIYGNGGIARVNGSTIFTDSNITTDTICLAMDLDNGALYIRRNDSAWMNSGNPESGATKTGAVTLPSDTYTWVVTSHNNSGSGRNYMKVNFGNGYFGTTAITSEGTNASGNGKFEYDVPTGYTALSTKGLNL